ncbi:MAG: GXGXG motif-containing protein [Chloroflexota bacterium]
MLSEKLAGRDHRAVFAHDEENFLYPDAYEVDFDKEAEVDAEGLTGPQVNRKIRELMRNGYGHIIVLNPGAKHSLGCGILNRLKLTFKGSLGYFGCGLNDGPNIHITGRVGWGCGENMMAGTVLIEKNAGSSFGAGFRGGDLVCKGDVGGRTGISMKGGTILVGGRTGYLSGFMMQRGRMIILGDAEENLGDSMYDGTIYVGGKIKSLGIDAVPGEMTDADVAWLSRKLKMYGMEAPNGVENIQKIVAGKKLWNYDSLEPSEKKIVL